MRRTLRNSKDFWTETEHASGDFFSALEFHWGRTPSYCMNFSLSYVKAVENILSNCRNGINNF